MEMIEFLSKYKINSESFKSTGLEWDNLMQIYNNHNKESEELEIAAKSIAELLRKINGVHSVKYRIKDSEHLIEKIIRKKIENTTLEINIDNYKNIITDLIGVRALHLYKDDWQSIHEFIKEKWRTKETPTANIRKGDPEANFKKHNLEIKEHKHGYRSIHYIISTTPYKEEIYAEVQVRTIFEEGWSEIDHNVRYPYDKDNQILSPYLYMFNSFAGSADEMGTYIKFLMNEISAINEKHEQELKDKNSLIEELKNKIDKLVKDETEKQEINQKINRLSGAYANIKLPDGVVNSLLNLSSVLSGFQLNTDGISNSLSTIINPAAGSSGIQLNTDGISNSLSTIINPVAGSSGIQLNTDGISNSLSTIINSASGSPGVKLPTDRSARNKEKEEHKL